ncbi:DUF4312 family protein [Lacticaseibacillus saniviri]|uniref:Cytoplasmic protein n=1 Tax=Lacticaseibacillus saniviri JCM 17471 = DSM 24301 TaxID=1293598 RepID=A0A0R2N1V8_9LACO|nr:DUF4312 family protein [Lacticaseibacillus saniviri]KRO17997.1 hypothetical protein IV56_GL001792 [Lacticaseibacillus saniviri JCM 17471 = DSM 24301]MCG4281748.1 DUF4312 family protein [Lacticaseibacillus saniviri]
MAAINQMQDVTVRVQGQGDTKQQAFAAALADIQKQLVGNESQTMLQIVPITVTPIQLDESMYKERFLFFFFPRVRTIYHVILEVTVQINSIALETLAFNVHKQTSPDELPLIPRLWRLVKGDE